LDRRERKGKGKDVELIEIQNIYAVAKNDYGVDKR
jgi:hypothetical protein